MANRDKLRRKLHAASKRRRRRASADPPAEGSGPGSGGNPQADGGKAASTDVTELIVAAILRRADGDPRRGGGDDWVVTALRAAARAGEPSDADAKALHGDLVRISQRSDVTAVSFRAAVGQMLELARSMDRGRGSGPGRAPFLEYLAVLSR